MMTETTTTTTLDSIADMIRAGRLEEARAALGDVQETEENRTELAFLNAFMIERSYDREGAIAAYEKVLDIDPNHTESAFRLALLVDLAGDDDNAIAFYERCVRQVRVPVHALMNLALLCEESGDLDRAEECLTCILREYPNHTRARRFLQSVKSSYTMVYDEQTQQERERRSAVLDMPIADFELSVRSRNCLKQMNIRTLGDLLRTTEYELLSYKNFGETSLNEIKAMLTQKGLKLGQAIQAAEPIPAVAAAPTVIAEEDTGAPESPSFFTSASQTPVTELELSVRARKALQRLGVVTLGELAVRSEAELLSIKNFGMTSLNEIKQQLTRFGLSFRQPGA